MLSVSEMLASYWRSYKLFISHSWSYDEQHLNLRQLLEKDKTFRYMDLSVPKNDPIHYASNDKELYAAIKSKIDRADVVLVLAGVYATHSKWMQLEMEAARDVSMHRVLTRHNRPDTVNKYHIPIIAVEGHGSERTSAIVKERADEVVAWNSASVINVIKKVA